jgi:hypothetical protein
MSTNDGLWYVKTPDGDVDRLTVDQLDEAFNSGRIDENVMVLPPDGSRWARLGELAGIEPGDDDRLSASPSSLPPVTLNTDELDVSFARRGPRFGVVFGAAVAVVAMVGVGIAIKNSRVLRIFHSSSAAAAPALVTAAPPHPVTIPPPPPPDPAPVASAPPPPSDSAASIPTVDVSKLKTAPAKGKQDKAKGKKKKRGGAAS